MCFLLTALLRRRAASVASGWLFFGIRNLKQDASSKTTTPVVFDAFPSFAGGELLIYFYIIHFFNRCFIE